MHLRRLVHPGAEKRVDGVVAGGEDDAFGGGAGGEKGGDGVGLAAVFPIGVCAGADGELQGGAVAGVAGIDGRAGSDEGSDDVVIGAVGYDALKEKIGNVKKCGKTTCG